MKDDKPLVAVWMITYNHAKYIANAIESVIKQKTTFPIKLFIGEDCSKDKTRDICIEHKKKHPESIDLIFNEHNDIAQNALNVYNACFNSGAKYIAMCEGDDYWTDPYKLQKQVDFLEANPEYAFCYHHVNVIQEDDFKNQKLEMKIKQPETSSIAEILKKSIWPHVNSIVFRNLSTFKKMPPWFKECPSGDWALLSMITGDKKIKYFNESMSVYRQHGNGIWSSNIKIQNDFNTLKTAKILSKHIVKKKERKYIYWPIHYAYRDLIQYYRSSQPFHAIRYSLLSAILNFNYTLITKRERAKELTWKEIIQKGVKVIKRKFLYKAA